MSNEGNGMVGNKSYTAALLLSFFLGGFGIHRFYTGYIGLGILQLLTAGGCGVWALIDFVSICFGKYKDAEGHELADYNPQLGKTMFFVWIVLLVVSIIYNATAATALLNSAH
ncbi:MAG: hypothetical protein BHW55_01580 [Candidatus Melainabacteria bacterium 35_41]|nr:MAG: hypothetical protein BHW55_01580 [Candidatus Melainabacteria bacterium 35_41]